MVRYLMDLGTGTLYSYIRPVPLITVVIMVVSLKLYRKYQISRFESKIVDISRLPTGAVTFDAIVNEFLNLKHISWAIRKAGLEKCQLILGIDFIASNEWQGRRTFSRKSLHAISEKVYECYGHRGSMHHLGSFRDNPYQKVISILGQTLEPLDDDNLNPAFGFGDSITKDKDVFSLSGLVLIVNRINKLIGTEMTRSLICPNLNRNIS